MPFQLTGAQEISLRNIPSWISAVDAAIILTMPEGLELRARTPLLRSAQFGLEHCFGIQTMWESAYYDDAFGVITWGEQGTARINTDFWVGPFGAVHEFNAQLIGRESPLNPGLNLAFVEDVADGILSEHGMFKLLSGAGT